MKKAFIEDYEGVIGFEVVNIGDSEDLIEYITKETNIFHSIKQIASKLDELGWTPSNAGNISVREKLYHTRFFITASGSHLSNLEEEDIISVQRIEVVVGEVPLYIGSNLGIDGELLPSRIIEVLDEQGLFESMKEELGMDDFDYRLLKEWEREIELCKKGRELMQELGLEQMCRQYPYSSGVIAETGELIIGPITPEALLTKRCIGVLAKEHNLTHEQVRSLYIARGCEGMSIYDLKLQGIMHQNHEILNAGLDLKTLITYLEKKGLINCKVYATGYRKPSSETLLHGMIYAKRHNINAIIHCHAPNIVKNPPKGIPITDTHQKIIGYGSLELAVEAMEALKDANCVLLKSHGPLALSALPGSWQRWIPIRAKEVYTLNEIFEPVLEDTFSVLREKDELAGRRSLISQIIEGVRHYTN